jgi:hypothetical protein
VKNGVVLLITGLGAVISAVAQTPFRGYVATSVDYFDCDPAVSSCTPKMNYTEKMLPSGESLREMKIPGGGPQANALISTKSRRIMVYPDVGKYYDQPGVRLPVFSSDEQCAARAVSMGPARFVRETQVAGFAAFQYETGHATVWLFPAVGCALLQSVTDFGTTKTYHILTALTAGFSDASVLEPGGVSSSPVDVRHDVFVANATSGAAAISKDTAEQKWAAAMADPKSSLCLSVTNAQSAWLRLHQQ